MEFIKIRGKLGEGGFGSVYLVYDKLIKEELAMKVLNFKGNSNSSHMITKEIEALG
jgi:serine/threonine protein kinase